MTKVDRLTRILALGLGPVLLMIAQHGRVDGIVSSRFVLSIHLERDRLAVGEPVKLSSTLKNVSRTAREYPESTDEWDYEFTVTDLNGRAPGMTEHGQWLATAERGGSRVIKTLDAGGELHRDFDLGKMFVFAPGRYCVRATRILFPESGRVVTRAVSNAVCFDVSK